MACIIKINSSKPKKEEVVFLKSGEQYSTVNIKVSTNEDQTDIIFRTKLIYSDLLTNNNACGVVNQKNFTLSHQIIGGLFKTTTQKHFSILHLKQNELQSIINYTHIL